MGSRQHKTRNKQQVCDQYRCACRVPGPSPQCINKHTHVGDKIYTSGKPSPENSDPNPRSSETPNPTYRTAWETQPRPCRWSHSWVGRGRRRAASGAQGLERSTKASMQQRAACWLHTSLGSLKQSGAPKCAKVRPSSAWGLIWASTTTPDKSGPPCVYCLNKHSAAAHRMCRAGICWPQGRLWG